MPFDAAWTEQRANVEKLARALEESETFYMEVFQHSCGTPACIAGHAIALWPDISSGHIRSSAGIGPNFSSFASMLGVDEEPLEALCVNWEYVALGGLYQTEITGRMAAAALRRLADTGEAYFSLDDA